MKVFNQEQYNNLNKTNFVTEILLFLKVVDLMEITILTSFSIDQIFF